MTPLSGREADQPTPANLLQGKRALMVLAQGFEDVEATCVLDVLGWTHYRPRAVTVTVDVCGFHARIRGAFGTTYEADVLIDQVDPRKYDALIVPGGFFNRGFEEVYDERFYRIARAMRSDRRPIATMCVGVLPVAQAGLLEGGTATTYALSSRHDNVGVLRSLGCEASDEPVVDCDGIISCSGPAYSEQVAYRLLERLVDHETVQEVSRYRRG